MCLLSSSAYVSLLSSLVLLSVSVKTNAQSNLAEIVSAIYRVEGGTNTRYPYGIKINNQRFTVSQARRICENTVRNNHSKWSRGSREKDFISYLGDIYCPKSVDAIGNKRWKSNMKKILAQAKR